LKAALAVLLYQIRRCSAHAPARSISGYTELVHEPRNFLSGRSASSNSNWRAKWKRPRPSSIRTAALYRDRLAACPRSVAAGHQSAQRGGGDVFAIHQEGGYSCVEVFFSAPDRTGAPRLLPARGESFTPEEVLASFCAVLRRQAAAETDLLSHTIEESELLADALSIKAGFRWKSRPPGAAKKEMIAHALTNAREALGRKSPIRDPGPALAGLVTRWAAASPSGSRSMTTATPGHQCGRRHDRGRADGFIKNQYRKFNISPKPDPGDITR